MFRLMRNVHLILGLLFFSYALLFASSSLVIIYRPWLTLTRDDQVRTVRVPPDQAQTPRALALELIRNQGLQGDLRDIQREAETIRFVIARPGTSSRVTYSAATGEAKIQTRREGFGCLTVLGAAAWYLAVSFLSIQSFPNGGLKDFQLGMGARSEFFPEACAGLRELMQGGQRVTKHCLMIKATGRLVERPKRFGVVGVQLKELVKQRLGDLAGGQIQLIEGTEQSQQIQPSRLQA